MTAKGFCENQALVSVTQNRPPRGLFNFPRPPLHDSYITCFSLFNSIKHGTDPQRITPSISPPSNTPLLLLSFGPSPLFSLLFPLLPALLNHHPPPNPPTPVAASHQSGSHPILPQTRAKRTATKHQQHTYPYIQTKPHKQSHRHGHIDEYHYHRSGRSAGCSPPVRIS